ncbi:DUF305 domain-containing protein [Ornithinimicrobium humiphilum]|uniref:Uncharacterized protein (DUF305 family) n=1 Tax=Ornithinimicrobium humiphilum TaxID=125288 RepID=A0A543KJI8_9MICO|nr:DUF305 domain-containing protein [Ornithinimicrobium humiphilum]TQM95252.1 uncharacterized protein (DUF305 family) [Ornithinimicrobium humiphilum]
MSARPVPALLLVALLSLGVAGCAGSDDSPDRAAATTITPEQPVIQPGAPGEANTTHTGPVVLPVEQASEADVTFVQSMIVHHAQAIEMVDLAEDGLEDEQVRAMADRIRAAQRPEIGAMVAWLAERGELVPPEAEDAGVDVAGHGATLGARARGDSHGHAGSADSMAGMATPEQLQQLGAAQGRKADTLFLRLMTAHHEGALIMLEEHGPQGIDARAREMADEMYVEQTAEIDRMAQLLERLEG